MLTSNLLWGEVEHAVWDRTRWKQKPQPYVPPGNEGTNYDKLTDFLKGFNDINYHRINLKKQNKSSLLFLILDSALLCII